jgi:uncharacterized protein (TIGR02246 family)
MKADTPEDCDRLFVACVTAGDLDGLVSLYEPGARFVTRGGDVAMGREAIRNALQRLTKVATEIEIHVVKVVALDAIAVIYNDWTTRATRDDGRVLEANGRAIEIVRRQPDGRWLFAIDDPFGRSTSTTTRSSER